MDAPNRRGALLVTRLELGALAAGRARRRGRRARPDSCGCCRGGQRASRSTRWRSARASNRAIFCRARIDETAIDKSEPRTCSTRAAPRRRVGAGADPGRRRRGHSTVGVDVRRQHRQLRASSTIARRRPAPSTSLAAPGSNVRCRPPRWSRRREHALVSRYRRTDADRAADRPRRYFGEAPPPLHTRAAPPESAHRRRETPWPIRSTSSTPPRESTPYLARAHRAGGRYAERRDRGARRRRSRSSAAWIGHRHAGARPSWPRTVVHVANFHTTALCSLTRSCVLTGRNHHANGMGRIIELATGSSSIPRASRARTASCPRCWCPHGFAAYGRQAAH